MNLLWIIPITFLIASILSSLLVLSLWIADRLEARRRRQYMDLTTFQQGMERIITREQPL